MEMKNRSRHVSKQDLYRTILLEEGCDVETPQSQRRVSRKGTMTVYSTDSTRWIPQFRVMFGESFAG